MKLFELFDLNEAPPRSTKNAFTNPGERKRWDHAPNEPFKIVNQRKQKSEKNNAINRELKGLEKQFVNAIFPGWETKRDTNGNPYLPYKILNMARRRAAQAGIINKITCPTCNGLHLHPIGKETTGTGCPECHNIGSIFPPISQGDVIRATKLKNTKPDWEEYDQESNEEGKKWRDHKNSMQNKKYAFVKNGHADPRGPWCDDGNGRLNFPDGENCKYPKCMGKSYHPAKILTKNNVEKIDWLDQNGKIHHGETWEDVFGPVSQEEKNDIRPWKRRSEGEYDVDATNYQ